MKRTLVIAAALWFAGTVAAQADPCQAKLPKLGTSFEGVVRYVGDGDSLCVGESDNPSEWIEVRVADFYAPELNKPGGREAKAALERIAMGRRARCLAGKRSYDRVVATCSVGNQSIADWLRAAGVKEGGRGR